MAVSEPLFYTLVVAYAGAVLALAWRVSRPKPGRLPMGWVGFAQLILWGLPVVALGVSLAVTSESFMVLALLGWATALYVFGLQVVVVCIWWLVLRRRRPSA